MITHTTTTRLRLRIRDHLHVFLAQRDPLVVLASLIAVPLIAIILVSAAYRSATAPAVAVQPTPQLPIIIVATAQAQPVTTPAAVVAAVLPNTLRRAVVAYDAPNGAALGAIEQGRAYAVLARWGADWLQADVVGSGVVWLLSADVLDLPADLADLQPPPAPAVVYVSAPAAPAGAVPTIEQPYQTSNQPPAGDFYAPPNTSIEARQALIGGDPNALACGGSPLCGGMTNAEAQTALDRQRNIQNRLVDPNVVEE